MASRVNDSDSENEIVGCSSGSKRRNTIESSDDGETEDNDNQTSSKRVRRRLFVPQSESSDEEVREIEDYGEKEKNRQGFLEELNFFALFLLDSMRCYHWSKIALFQRKFRWSFCNIFRVKKSQKISLRDVFLTHHVTLSLRLL